MLTLSAAVFLFHACDMPESGSPWSLPPYIQDKGGSSFTLKIDEGVTTIKAGEYAAVPSIGSGADKKTFNTKITRQALGLETDGEVRTAVTTIILPSTLVKIEDYAFYGHTAVKGTLIIPNKVQSIGASAFGKTGTALTLDLKDDSKLGTIGAGAFDIASIAKIQAPRFTLTKNADNTTYTLAVAEGVTTVAKGEFSSRESTGGSTPITLNTRLKGALLGAEPQDAITTITLPSTLVTIEDYAFWEHEKVQGTLTIPKTVQSIGKHAFESLGLDSGAGSLLVIAFAPDSQLTTIKAEAFVNTGITSLTLPEKLETIGTGAFAYPRLTDKKMSSFTIPANIKNIGFAAFSRMRFSDSATLTIQSPSVTLENQLFVNSPTDTVFTTVKLPQVLYDGYTKAELASRFGQVTVYQDLDGSAHTPKP